ncbi:PAS domain S-box protein [Clostridium tagluense]|uniref:PAS domain S-box protein n=1 Tax=Clostridium tagluense TaxID=360422 RepID=UPI00163A780A|nr:PAS domain S-box protein [Clostridium tagluense]
MKTIPIARNTVFHNSKDGIIILDYNENIIDFNQVAISIFEGLTDKHLNHKFYHLFPEWLEIGDLSEKNESFEFSLTKSGAERYYSLENIRLKTKTNSTLGWLLTVSDITKLINNQKQLELQMLLLDMGYCNYNNSEINVTASFGVTGFENYSAESSVQILIKAVDLALYSVKTSGRNKVAFQSVESQCNINV